jgi:probable rRNA maturation factor
MPHGPAASDISRLGFELSLANEQSVHAVDAQRLLSAARRILEDSKLTSAAISVAVVDDPRIHALNRQFLEHDWPTDVLSFPLDSSDGHLDGEIILSADTAASAAEKHGTIAADEQLLYVIHGMLHLLGYDDKRPDDAAQMRAAEQRYLKQFGANPPTDCSLQRPVEPEGTTAQ